MRSGVGEAELSEVDAHLAADKVLVGGYPEWLDGYASEKTARWGVADLDGLQVAELVFTVRRDHSHPSILLLHRKRLVHRTDLVSGNEAKLNPILALRVNAPASVAGSHWHMWSDNREHVRVAGFGQLPVRRPTPSALRTFPQAIADTLQQLNITADREQWGFDLPAQANLF